MLSFTGLSDHPLCGPTATDTTFAIAGLLSFQIPFSQIEIPEQVYAQQRPSYRRWNLWLRHGLAGRTGDLQKAITISPEVDFTLTALNRATIRMEGAFEPATTYTITVAASPRVVDGFDLPLLGGGSTFETADQPTFFIEAGSYQTADAVFPEAAGFPQAWTALAQGTDQCLMSYNDRAGGCGGHQPKYIDGFAVTLAVGETVILMTPPFLSILKHLLKVEGGAVK